MTRSSISRERRERLRSLFSPSEIERQYPRHDAGIRFLFDCRWRAILEVLRRLREIQGPLRYLEVGSGIGEGLREVSAGGVTRGPIVGVDLVVENLLATRQSCPDARLVWADGADLPFADASCDVVAHVMLLSSVLDPALRRCVAAEALRVVRPGGWIVAMDLRLPQIPPFSRVAVGLSSLRALIPGELIETSTHGMLPPLARWLAPGLPRVCRVLSHVPLMRVYR